MHRIKIAQNQEKLKEVIRAMVLDAGFVRGRFLAPFNPHGSMPEQYRTGSPSLLVAALGYGNQNHTEPASDPYRGVIAPFARRNYYRTAVRRLQELAKELRLRYGGAKADFRILCNSPVPEKPLAVACGLGVLGRNGLVITPEAGSLIIIAAMTLPFEVIGDGPITGHYCAACDPDLPPCAEACPTKGLCGDGSITLSRCIQWYASGREETVPAEVVRHWGNRLYGCTACQDACVHNRRPLYGVRVEEGSLPAHLDLHELLEMSDEAMKARFKGTALGFSWLGPQGIRRNARMILEYLRQYKK
ncbi:MAG: hypothetical protein LBG73_04230 [Spirochaetaceae bacterium]|jgi:epoxyqueuosine reductase|nr:hypothetical protein [Spirochaetaceae bacterium]